MSVVTTPRPKAADAGEIPTDHRLQGHVQTALQRSYYYEIQNVTCSCHEDVVVLHGKVSSFYLKQVAQTIVRQVAGVEEIFNRLTVVYPTRKTNSQHRHHA
jgi:osmotically-inducible protein OsmY